MIYATDHKGRALPVSQRREGASLFLTLKKEEFCQAESVELLSELTMATAGEEGFYLVPRGISLMGDLYTRFTSREDGEYVVWRPVMATAVVKTPRFCGLIRFERSYRVGYRIRVKDGGYSLSLLYSFSDEETVNYDKPHDDIRIELVELPSAKTPGDFAKAERELRLERGEITPLAQKCKREIVEYSRKHPLVRIRMGWKPSPSYCKHQTKENEPVMHAAVSFARVRDIADALKAEGVEGADLQLVGWNKSGHDGCFPQLFPVEPALGGEKELRKTIDYVKSLGYKISLHTNLLDSYEIGEGFSWDNVCLRQDGNYLQRGDYSGGYSYIVCPKKQQEISRRHMDEIDSLGVNGMHFTDVISIITPDVCHSSEHPCSTKEGIQVSQRIMKETGERRGGFSSEGAFDFAVGSLDYALYVCFGDGFGAKTIGVCDQYYPFYELVYHGILLYNPMSPTVNFSIKNERDRLLFFLRGGRPTFYFHSRFRADGSDWMGKCDLSADSNESLQFAARAIAQGVKQYGEFADRQLVYMKDYVICGDGLELCEYEDGVRLVGNFSAEERVFEGHTIAAGELLVLS